MLLSIPFSPAVGSTPDRKSTRLNSSHQSTRRLTLFPYTTLFRSVLTSELDVQPAREDARARIDVVVDPVQPGRRIDARSEEHTSELQSPIDTSFDTLSLHDALPICLDLRTGRSARS